MKKGTLFDYVNVILLFLISIVMLYPFVNIIAVSVSSYAAFIRNPLMIFPEEFTLSSFRYVFSNPLILNGYLNTILVTIAGTLLSLVLTTMTAYPLSKKNFLFKGFFVNIIIFTWLFNGGIIPNFFLIRNLGMLDSLWSLIMPGMVVAFNVLLMKNFFEGLPDSLEEAAKIDGASDISIMWKIIIPLSKPIMATIALFIAVGYWNNYFNAVLYIKDNAKWPLQLILREIITASETNILQTGGNLAEISNELPTQGLKYATLIVVIIPILLVYPYLQRYFVGGITMGAVKE